MSFSADQVIKGYEYKSLNQACWLVLIWIEDAPCTCSRPPADSMGLSACQVMLVEKTWSMQISTKQAVLY